MMTKGLEVGNGGGHSSKYALTFSRAAQLIEPFLYNIALQSLSYFVLQHCFWPQNIWILFMWVKDKNIRLRDASSERE